MKILRIPVLSIANFQIYINISWLTQSGETNAWSSCRQRKCPSTNYVFFFFNTFFSAIIWHICAELNDHVGKKKEPLPLTRLDTCRMLSISSTGNVVSLNGRGGEGVTSIQSGSYVAWCDRHFRGFCKWKRSGSSSQDRCVGNVLIVEAEKWSCLQGCLH